MSLIVESTESYDSMSGPSDRTTFFGASHMSIQTVVTKLRFETYVIPQTISTTDPSKYFIISHPGSNLTGKKRDDRAIFISDLAGWDADIKVGDSWIITGTLTSNSTGLILEISENRQTIITDHNFAGSAETFPLAAEFGITTPQRSLEYKFNIVENDSGETYESAIDQELQRALVGELDSSDEITIHTMIMQGKKSWQFGFLTVRGNGIGDGNPLLAAGVVQAFEIIHTVINGPPILFDQWEDTISGIPPTRYLGGNSPKYINSIGLSAQKNNPNDITTVVQNTLLGNCGFFGENLNGGVSHYSLQNVVYKRLDDTANPSLELTTQETKVQFSIFNTETSPFLSGSSIVIITIQFAPSDPAQYSGPTAENNTQGYNFIIDQIVDTAGSGGAATSYNAINGFTDIQSIKSATITVVSPSQIDVDLRMEQVLDIVSRISINEDQRFILSAEVSDYRLSRADTDKVPLLIDAGDFYTDNTDPTLFTIDNGFVRHIDSDPDVTEEFITAKPEDDPLSVNNIILHKTGRESDVIDISTMRGEIYAKKIATGAAFVLDARQFNLETELVNHTSFGGIADVNLRADRGFKTPADDNRATIKFFRQYGLDTGGDFFYRWQMPHIMRWENYVEIDKPALVDDEFFDPNEPLNGRNHDWFRYADRADWAIYYRLTMNVLKNGNLLPFIKEQQIPMVTYEADPNWIAEEIISFDELGAELTTGPTSFVNGAINGRIQANFKWIGGVNPDVTDIEIVLKIHVFEQGTYKSTYWISSVYDKHPNTYFTSIDGSNRVVVTVETGDVFRGEAILVGAKLPKRAQFSITARLYDRRGELPPVPPAVGMLEEDGTFMLEEGGGTVFMIEE